MEKFNSIRTNLNGSERERIRSTREKVQTVVLQPVSDLNSFVYEPLSWNSTTGPLNRKELEPKT